MSLSVDSIKIIDSYNYLPMPLSALPKTFGLQEACKGYFPHLFNRKENWGYTGPIPDRYYYCPGDMKKDVRKAFDEWYKNQKDKVNFTI